jgi:hypothetical protein
MGDMSTSCPLRRFFMQLPQAKEEFLPFANITTALTPRPPRLGEHDILLEQARPIRGAEGELIPRKLQVRVTAAVLQCSQRLRELLETAKPGQELLTAQIQADALSVEAVAKALEWTALPPDEQTQLFEYASVKSLINVMHAAAWLGSNTLKSICETKLCAVLCLENVRRKCRARAHAALALLRDCATALRRPPATPDLCARGLQAVQLARAAERCESPKLLARSFFLLKAFFCADDDASRPRRADGLKTHVPRIEGKSSIKQANTTMLVNAWQPVIGAWEATMARLTAAQPCYVLCTLTRERSDTQPSLYRLVSEHDGRLMLIARQRWPGEGDFLIFAPPGAAAATAVASVPAASTAGDATDGADAAESREAGEDGEAGEGGKESQGRQKAAASGAAVPRPPRPPPPAAYEKAAVEAFVRSIATAEPEALPEHTAAFRGSVRHQWFSA